jgi:quercetin dioxygenase-like cupin family protein
MTSKVFLIAAAILTLATTLTGVVQAQPVGLSVVPVIRTSVTVLNQPIVYVKTDNPEVISVVQTYAPGAQTGWHSHLASSHIYVLEGVLTLEIEGSAEKEFQAGQAYMESVDILHNARNKSDKPLKLLVVTFGARGVINNIAKK